MTHFGAYDIIEEGDTTYRSDQLTAHGHQSLTWKTNLHQKIKVGIAVPEITSKHQVIL